MLWLHDRGYNLFTINKLTYGEIGWLTDAWNRLQKEKEKQYKKNKK